MNGVIFAVATILLSLLIFAISSSLSVTALFILVMVLIPTVMVGMYRATWKGTLFVSGLMFVYVFVDILTRT